MAAPLKGMRGLKGPDCGLCSKPFTKIVTLGCKHNFCSACLRTHWNQRNTGNCPFCDRRWSKELPPNFSSEKQEVFAKTSTVRSKEHTQETMKRKHPEDASTSATDKPLSLPSTSKSSVGRHDPKESKWLRTQIKYLRRDKHRNERGEKIYEGMFEHLYSQAQSCECLIREQFERLHRILRQEEEECIRALREEQQKKVKIIHQEIKNIQSQLGVLSEQIRSVERQLPSETTESPKMGLISKPSSSYFLEPDPELKSGLLIDKAKILGNLGFRVWEKIRSEVHYSPVILDPNTANTKLYLSDDMTKVRQESQHQMLPENPERFTYFSAVLGSEGFSSGTHQWDVEVGDHPQWEIGLAKKSADRKAMFSVLPKNGFWSLKLFNSKYLDADNKTIELQSRPDRIRVKVDYDNGCVSFYNVKDITEICSHKNTFREKVFPYFSVGKAGDAKTKNIQICPTDGSPASGYSPF